jgi:phage-related protein
MSEVRGEPKDIEFVDTALDDLRAFPEDARRDAGYQLDKVQHGENADDWKPFPTVGTGTREIRITDDGDAFRVMYVAKFGDKIHVLHCFQKKTQATSKKDIDLARKRYANLKREFGK